MLEQLDDKCPAVKKAVTLIFALLRPSKYQSKEMYYSTQWRTQFLRKVQNVTNRYPRHLDSNGSGDTQARVQIRLQS